MSFTSTTTMNGSAVYTIGGWDNGDGVLKKEAGDSQYGYGIDINSSFTGEDLLTVGLVQGNASNSHLASMDSAEFESTLKITSAFYTMPIGPATMTIGPLLDSDDVVAATLSAYSDSFMLCSAPYSLSGEVTGPGIGFAYSETNGNVFSASAVYGGNDRKLESSIFDSEYLAKTITVGHNGDRFGGGLAYFHGGKSVANGSDFESLAIGGYYSPDAVPATVSFAVDKLISATGKTEHVKATDFFLAVDYEYGPGTISAACNANRPKKEKVGCKNYNSFELAYTYDMNDDISIQPGIWLKGNPEATKQKKTFGWAIDMILNF